MTEFKNWVKGSHPIVCPIDANGRGDIHLPAANNTQHTNYIKLHYTNPE